MSNTLLTAIVFLKRDNSRALKYRNINGMQGLKGLIRFLAKNQFDWKYINLYKKRTREFDRRVYPNTNL